MSKPNKKPADVSNREIYEFLIQEFNTNFNKLENMEMMFYAEIDALNDELYHLKRENAAMRELVLLNQKNRYLKLDAVKHLKKNLLRAKK